MVIPMPAVSMGSSPSDYAMSWRNTIFFLNFFVGLSGILQMFLFKNILGGFMTCVVAGIGLYCIREKGIDMSCLVTWGMFTCLNGVLDTVTMIDRFVKLPPGVEIFSLQQPFLLNIAMALLICGPLCEIACAWVVYQIYKDSNGIDDSRSENQGSWGQAAYGTMPDMGGSNAGGGNNNSRRTGGGNSFTAAPAFTPFAGKGNVLGAENV